MLDDQQLLHQYADEGSEAAFGELVARHLNLVYSVALRVGGGDPHLAQDAAQMVFSDLARKARRLQPKVVLAGWLHRATKYAAVQLLRTNRRRQAREQEAVAMKAFETGPTPDWEAIRPLLDDALDRLVPADRDALLLRFFEQRTLGEVGRALGSNEDAARKRVTRALEKLRADLVRRGMPTSAAALSVAMSTCAVQAAPAGLATTLASASLAGAGACFTSTTLLKIMTMTKLKTGIALTLVVAGVTTALVIQHQAKARLRAEYDSLSEQFGKLMADNEALSNSLSLARRSQSLGVEQFAELMKLRGESRLLGQQSNSLARLKEENLKLKSALTKAAASGPGPAAETEQQQQGRERMSYAKNWAQAFLTYAETNNSRLPASFDQVLNLAPDQTGAKIQLDPGQFEITFQGSLKEPGILSAADHIIILREKQPWQGADGSWARTYSFLDGHSVIQVSSDGNFAPWEQQHAPPPPPVSQ